MKTALDYISLFLGLCAFIVFCFGAYHEFIYKNAWRREWSEGRGRWGLYNSNIPEPYRTHRRRSLQAALMFFGVMALGSLVLYVQRNA